MELHGQNRRALIKTIGLGSLSRAIPFGGLVGGLASPAVSVAATAGAKYKLRFGTIYTKSAAEYTAPGIYDFAERIYANSEGEIAVQIIDKAQACSEDQCAQRVMNGILNMGSSTFQNTGAVMPYSVALDWPFLWKSRVAYHNFLFSKQSVELYRNVLLQNYGIVPLFASGGMRNIMMGMKYGDRPDITSPEDLRNAKIRITNSDMISNFAKSLDMSPIPLAWGELMEGLKTGLVDAAETYPSAAAGFGMYTVLSQDVDIQFAPGYSMIFMDRRTYEKLPERLQEVVLETSWETMVHAYNSATEAESSLVGIGANPSEDSAYRKSGLRQVHLSEDQRAQFHAKGAVENNAELYAALRKQLDGIVGFDVYGALQDAAAKVSATELQPTKWWL